VSLGRGAALGLVFALALGGCGGDHYEGGGRRQELPTREQTQSPSIDAGGSTTSGGAPVVSGGAPQAGGGAAGVGAAGDGGAAGLPQAGSH
jgi:hypothetical protein